MYLYLVKNFRANDSRNLLARALCHYSGGKRYVIREEEKGKPYAVSEDEQSEAPFFSVSHTGRFWACLVGTCRVGLDIEDGSLRRKQPERVVERFFSRREQDYIKATGMAQFLPLWVRKEAYTKWKGTGLSEGLNNFSVVGQVEAGQLCACSDEPQLNLLERVGSGYLQEIPLADARKGETASLVGAVCADEPFYLEQVLWLPEKPAKEEAVSYLQYRERCSFEVRKHLEQKGYHSAEIQDAEAFLQEYRYLDDARYGCLYIRGARQKGKGRMRIQNELAQKGFDTETINHCFSQAETDARSLIEEDGGVAPSDFGEEQGDSEMERAMEQAGKMLRRRDSVEPLTDKEKAKIARRLAYLGYSASVTYRVIGSLK